MTLRMEPFKNNNNNKSKDQYTHTQKKKAEHVAQSHCGITLEYSFNACGLVNTKSQYSGF